MSVPEAVVAAESPESPKPKILFIDDDLRPPRFSSLPHQLQATLSDINSPDLEALWALGRQLIQLEDISALAADVALRRVQQDDFVNSVLLSPRAHLAVSEATQTSLESYRVELDAMLVFAESVRKAFPSDAFVMQELGERPPDKEQLLEADLLILDLIMGSGDPIAAIKTFLGELGVEAADRSLPPILLVSLHDDLLKQHHLDIRSTAHISASGLFVLSKSDVRTPTGHFILSALWSQLRDRRDAAVKMRALCLSVNAAFDKVRLLTMKTLWSLDVASMHQIYVTARSENDSYNEHMLELLSREVLWHLESSDSVTTALAALNTEFKRSIKESEGKPEVIFRYPSFVGMNMEALRSLVNHHACTPILPEGRVDGLDLAANPWGIPSVLPFGAVIKQSDFDVTKEVLINITPQCDLIKKKIVKESLSLVFVTARTLSPLDSKPEDDAVVIQGVSISGVDYDLSVFPNRMLSGKAEELIQLAKDRQWKVSARLRADVAKQVQQAISSHLARRDALSTTGGSNSRCGVCLRVGNETIWYADGTFALAKHVTLSSTSSSKVHIFDQEAFSVAIWASKILAEKISADPFGNAAFVSELCELFQKGLGKQHGFGTLLIKTEACIDEKAEGLPKGQQVPKGSQALMLMLYSSP